MQNKAAPDWMDKTGFGVVGRLTLDGGEQLAAEIVGFEEETNELVVQPIVTASANTSLQKSTRAIAVDTVVSFEPDSRSSHAWPHSDPCRERSFSGARFALMSTLFVCLTAGSLALFVAFMDGAPYRLQQLSAVSYTVFATFGTFAALRGAQPYMFTCPAVTSQIPKLLRRHVGFLLALFLLETAALAIRPSLPAWWDVPDNKGRRPFELTVMLLCFGLGFVQVFTNRLALERAHSEFSG